MEQVTPYEVRERVKQLADTNTAEGIELVMLMHYERSRESWRQKRQLHPSWAAYARAYTAQPHFERWGERSAEAIAEVRRRYPPQPDERLPDGRSEWSRQAP